ncbi:Na+/H+ antiporter subunit D [Halobacteriales archaeon QS_1_68_20]|nr:MAG: Na+/H+ antiporter subunit D [Halobacteriales archaeon QS_1_68_20]
MARTVVVAPMLVALGAAIATLLTRRFDRAKVGLSLAGGIAYVVAVAALFAEVGTEGILTYQLSGWGAPFGITLVADALSAFMLALAAIVSLPALVFAVRYVGEQGQQVSFHPVFHFMMVGVTGAFLTGDVFNLFVWFEVMLMSSYVLVVFYGGGPHTRAGIRYVFLNLAGSAFMLVAIGGLYATVGTLNMADIARRLGDPVTYGVDPAPVLGLAAILLAVFALKAGLVPFQFWVPGAYRAAPAPVSAVLAGVVKKVGVYAIVRLYFTVFGVGTVPGGLGLPGLDGASFLNFFGPVLFVMAVASIGVGGVVAVARDDVDELLAYSSISQVGFIVLPLAVGATVPAVRDLAIAATLVYSLNHAVAKGLLFLTSGAIYEAVGSIDLRDLGGIVEESPTLAGGFFVGGLALVGIPPLSGFFGKMLVFDATARAGADLALGAALVGAVLTIAYFSRAWNRGFWGEPSEAVAEARPSGVQLSVVITLGLVVVAIGVGFDPVFEAASRPSNSRR